ncbi:MAG TPA: hypothetical protein VEZ46_06420 [Mycobacteriales bacterium]|nr:hypothetical protein [Mycobacteriales bacterium]
MADDDVLSVGGDPPPPSHALKVALVIALIAFGGWRLTDGARSGPDAAPSTPPSAVLTPTPTPARAASPSASPRPTSDHRHVSVGAPTTARLLLAGPVAMDVPLDGSRTRTLGVQGAVTQAVHAASGDFVLATPGGGRVGAYFVSRDRGRITPLGAAAAIVPASQPDMVWLADAGSAIGQLRLMTSTGVVLRLIDTGPDSRAVIREVPEGFVTVRVRDHSASLELWDAHTGEVVRSFGTGERVTVLAANATHVAFTLPACPRECPIFLSHLATGDTKRVTVPAVWHSGAAEFSPDGRTLAVVGVRGYEGLPGHNRLLLVDVAEGRTRAARSLDPRNQPLSLISWAPDGEWVFAASRGPASNVLGYQVRESRVRHVVDARAGVDVTFDDLTALTAY